MPRRSVLGVDYYEWNEKLIDSDGNPRALGELFGWYVIASQYWRALPAADDAHRNQPHRRVAMRRAGCGGSGTMSSCCASAGVPLVGFTWYSLTDQIDWGPRDRRADWAASTRSGLFDLNRDPRPVGLSYKHLIDMHRDAAGLSRLPGG